MHGSVKPKVILISQSGDPSISSEKLGIILSKVSDLKKVDAKNIHSELTPDMLAESKFFAESSILEQVLPLVTKRNYSRNIVIFGEELAPDRRKETSECSRLELKGMTNPNLAKVLTMIVSAEPYPGLNSIIDDKTTAHYAKILSSERMGGRIDGLVSELVAVDAEYRKYAYLIRALSFALCAKSGDDDEAAGKKVRAADLQISVSSGRVNFCVSYGTSDKKHEEIIKEIYQEQPQEWIGLCRSIEFLCVTRVKEKKITEVRGWTRAQATNGAGSFIFLWHDKYKIDERLKSSLQKNRATPIKNLEEKNKIQAEGQEDSSIDSEAQDSDESPEALNLKLKNNILENERNTLQGLVKKKNQLVSELNKDVNKAHREAIKAKNEAAKELLVLRMSSEKKDKEILELKAKLNREEKKEESKQGIETQEATRSEKLKDAELTIKKMDFERKAAEEKISELNKKIEIIEETLSKIRKEDSDLKKELAESKSKILKFEKDAEMIARTKSEGHVENNGNEDDANKIKELQKNFSDSRAKEQELEKEVKRLTLKLEGADQSVKGIQSKSEKNLETTEKLLEETKKRLSEVSK